MENSLLRFLKYLLTLVGSKLSRHYLHQFQMVTNYLILGKWMSEHNFYFNYRVRNRNEVFSAVVNQVRNEPILYLEFGVFKGASMKYWSTELKHPDTKLHGFDSFEGLPEDFDLYGPHTRGKFDLAGVPPTIEDNRVQFFKGLFHKVLPNYSIPKHNILVINMDADLYSSTIYVLRYLRPFIKRGTFIYFDNMSRPEHEPKAFAEFIKESGLKFKPVCADQSLNNAFFQCVGY